MAPSKEFQKLENPAVQEFISVNEENIVQV